MAGFNTRTLVIISRLPRRPPFHSFQTQEPQVPMELTFSACFASRNMPPYLSSPGTNPPGSGAVIFLTAIWNYKLLRRRPQNQAKWLKRLPRGAERSLHLKEDQFTSIFSTTENFPAFFFFFFLLLSCENEAQHQDGYGSRPWVTNDEGPVGKPFSPPLSGHQEWKQLLFSEPSAPHPPRPHPASLAHTSSSPLDTPPAGRTPGFCSILALLPNFSFP